MEEELLIPVPSLFFMHVARYAAGKRLAVWLVLPLLCFGNLSV